MKTTFCDQVERGRIRSGPYGSTLGAHYGAFRLRIDGCVLCILVSDGDGWDHVSVSLSYRCPTWNEMCAVKRLFFRDDETVVQIHPPRRLHVNYHPYCLHLWRPQGAAIPLPPMKMIAPMPGEPILG